MIKKHMPSIFSKIVSGEIPCHKVYEDDLTFAFLDINPASRGHTLVICKQEFPDLFSIPPATLAAVAVSSQKVAQAIREALKPDGLNVLQNNGPAAGQEVFHYHVHLIPRWQSDGAFALWKSKAGHGSDIAAAADAIRAAIL